MREWRLAVTASKGMKRKVAAMIIGLALSGLLAQPGAGRRALPIRRPSRESDGTRQCQQGRGLARPACRQISRGSRIGSGLQIGAWEGNLELMRVFIAHGADIDYRNHIGDGAVAGRLARKDGGGPVAARTGAHINAGEKQWSALHYAVFAGHGDIARLLMEQGAPTSTPAAPTAPAS